MDWAWQTNTGGGLTHEGLLLESRSDWSGIGDLGVPAFAGVERVDDVGERAVAAAVLEEQVVAAGLRGKVVDHARENGFFEAQAGIGRAGVDVGIDEVGSGERDDDVFVGRERSAVHVAHLDAHAAGEGSVAGPAVAVHL
jgi:hypothetical protein